MASTKLYLDTRAVENGSPAPLKVVITSGRSTALIKLDVSLTAAQWNKLQQKVVNHPNKMTLNAHILQRKAEIDNVMMRLADDGELRGLTATAIKKRILSELNPEEGMENFFLPTYIRFTQSKEKRGTRDTYAHTISRMRAFDRKIETRRFEDIDIRWLTEFERYLALTANKNARNIHLRNIRAVFNAAIDDEITSFYPFRKFKIRPVPTVKRSLTVEELRTLFAYQVEDYAHIHQDMFKLIFFLIGINVVDLHGLKKIERGRINYYRAKTGRLYSIKVEPEAMEIIEKYRGVNGLLSIADDYVDYRNYRQRINIALKRIGEMHREGRGGKKIFKPLFPELTTYWARHTWATIAASLDIPKETIAAALGHGGNTVTDIYIDFDRKKVDEANRRVIDYVLYDKK